MAVGLIKKQIIHTKDGESSSVSPFKKTRNQQRLEEAETAFANEMTAFKDFTFTNPYAQNVYANMENTAEDLTINQQAANFQAQQAQQSQANILSTLQAGGGFNAGNIQALANQAQLGAQKAAASIGQQESANQRMAAQQEAQNQRLERQGMLQVQKGAADIQQKEFDRQSTQLGMSMQMVGNAQDAIAANKAMWGNIIGSVTGMVGDLATGGVFAKKKTNGAGGEVGGGKYGYGSNASNVVSGNNSLYPEGY
tara:strand:+ start:2167 stop:2925 length:759 start_codon:yes stop_codon:yes gene_type:complete